MVQAAERVTLVIPVRDEAAAIGGVLREVEAKIARGLPGLEVLVVDDGSGDGTAEAIASASLARVRRLDTGRHRGQGPAARLGADAAAGDWICQMDGDGQLDPGDFWKLWERRDEGDLILGVRRRRADPRHRVLLSRAVRAVVSRVAGRPLQDPAAPLRLFRRAVWQDARTTIPSRAIALSILVTVVAARRGERVVEVPVAHRPRVAGRSRIAGPRLVAFLARGAGELLVVHRRLR